MTINIIDLFAGPGGLGEGFSAYRDKGNFPFKIVASIEKNPKAHKTLQLRAFFRQFRGKEIPDEYYEYVRNSNFRNANILRKGLFDIYKDESKRAIEETLEKPRTLGDRDDDKFIEKTIARLLKEKGISHNVVIGGPPCQAYSLTGKSRLKGDKEYSIDNDGRARLYVEYLKILNLVQPSVFVMENVKGILSTKLDGDDFFPKLLNDLGNPGKIFNNNKKAKYKLFSFVADASALHQSSIDPNKRNLFTIKSELYGIPQARHRVIILGIREDVCRIPRLLEESSLLSVQSVIGGMPRLRSGCTDKGYKNCNGVKWAEKIEKKGKELINELKRINESDQANFVKVY